MTLSTTSVAAAAARAHQSSETIELKNTSKRDFLVSLEKKYQKEWREARLFEVESPLAKNPSLRTLLPAELRQKYPLFFGTYPYPYMNGSLHLGHGFTLSKIEFAAGFERMLGKRVLFPHGFHLTGMPIKAAADKLLREMEMFGEDFERYTEDETPESDSIVVSSNPASSAEPKGSSSETTSNVGKVQKSKVAAKATGLTYQFQIMESIGVARKEIKKFGDPTYWASYFPPIAQQDLNDFGARIDWRRSFVTTKRNPYYDSFVRWQMNRLRELDYIKFGKRYTIYSPKDDQPCMDHDRASGENVGPQEYTGLKLEVIDWSPNAKSLGQATDGKKVHLIAATLRPETMYGQTNCFVGINIKYGLYAAANTDSLFLCTQRAARNMAYQGLLKEQVPQPEALATIQGKDLIGTKIHPPLSVYKEVYLLPMDNVLATKGTGVVTSVPSDSPDDYATLMDLRKKTEFYGIQPEWAAFEPVPVLSTPTYGNMMAPALCKSMKIQSQKDVKQLAEAKEIAYREGFYQGTMLIGPFKGERVEAAKNKVRDDLVSKGEAFIYSEPEKQVISRSADECVVALCDQWYIAYGESSWRAKAETLLSRMNTYSPETRNAFEGVLDWLKEWACSRSYGLGSDLPWDPQFLVESLSDSTIYMSYYTFCHLLHTDIYGDDKGPLDIKPEDMTDEVWDYVFCRTDTYPSQCPLPKGKADILRGEFSYFYPMSLRTSGKDLIPNHLSFCIYVHAALFNKEYWPLSMRANGHLLLNGKKMSKSTGNSLTLANSIQKFGADATRMTLADAGDSMDDANFEEYGANAAILRMQTFFDWAEETLKDKSVLRMGPKDSFYDRVFENEIDSAIVKTKEAYVGAQYKLAMKTSFYELLIARDVYRDTTLDEGMHYDLIAYYLKIQALLIQPIAPHFAEHLWKAILGYTTSVQLELFPEPSSPVDNGVLDEAEYVRITLKSVRDTELSFIKKASRGKSPASYDPNAPKRLGIFIASSFPEWQTACVEAVHDSYDEATGTVDQTKVRKLLTERKAMDSKRSMPFCVAFAKRVSTLGTKSFDRAIHFDECQRLIEVMPYLKRQLGFSDIEVLTVEEAKKPEFGWNPKMVDQAEPGSPSYEFKNTKAS